MKILSALLLSLTGCVLLALSGCAKKTENTSGPGARIKIGYLVKQPEEPWFQYEWKGAEKAAMQYGFDVVKLGVNDPEKVMTAIDNLAAVGAKGFVICTPDVRLGPAIVNRAAQNDLKVVSVDDQFVGGDGRLMTDVHYLGMSAAQIGREVGQELFKEAQRRHWPLNETAVCAITFEELATARARTDGAIAALTDAGFPAERIFKGPQKTTDIPGSFAAANIVITQHLDVQHWLVCALNDTGVLGAVRAMEDRGFAARNVIGIGINGTDCIDELRKAQPTGFFGSMFVSAPGEGQRTAEMLYQWIRYGTEPALDTRTESIFITRENFEAVLKKEGIIP